MLPSIFYNEKWIIIASRLNEKCLKDFFNIVIKDKTNKTINTKIKQKDLNKTGSINSEYQHIFKNNIIFL